MHPKMNAIVALILDDDRWGPLYLKTKRLNDAWKRKSKKILDAT